MEKGTHIHWKAVWFGGATALVCYFLLLALAAWLTVSGRVGEERLSLLVDLSAFAASFLGTMSAAIKSGRDKGCMLLAAILFLAAVLLAGAALHGGVSAPRAFALTVSIPAGMLLSLLVFRRRKSRAGKRRKSVRSRR